MKPNNFPTEQISPNKQNQYLPSRAKQKDQNPELYKQSPNQYLPSRAKQKDQNPELYKQKRNEKMRQSRAKQKDQNPELYEMKRELENQRKRESRAKQKTLSKKEIIIQIWDNLFDYYKSTFSKPVSKKEWERLKQFELDNVHSEIPDWTVSLYEEMREDNLQRLRENPNHHCAGSMIFFIKTLVHRPKDIRSLTQDEIDFVFSFSPAFSSTEKNKMERRKEYYEKKKEHEKEVSKKYREKKKEEKNISQLNKDFIAADPNKVLSLSDIMYNPYMTNYSRREEFKVFLYRDLKPHEKDKYFEKWQDQRRAYEKEVEALDEDYKKNFLRVMKGKCYFDEWEERKERYLSSKCIKE